MSSNEEYIRKNKIVLVDDDKNTKLHYAAALENLEELDKIIKSGQKLDPENYLGWTPLMMAVKNVKCAAADLLLTKGADATKKNKFGTDVFLISVTTGDIDLVTKILNHLLCGGVSRQCLQRVISPISLAILFRHGHIFKYLLERSFDPNAPTLLTGITPAMFAAAVSNHKAVKRLIHFKADMSLKNRLGKTAADILISRQQKAEPDPCIDKSPHVPVVIINGTYAANGSCFQFSQTPNLIDYRRKSSNVATPAGVCTPTISPIPAGFPPQVFFGPDFIQNQMFSPATHLAYDNSILNATISPSAVFFSPLSAQPMCVANYM